MTRYVARMSQIERMSQVERMSQISNLSQLCMKSLLSRLVRQVAGQVCTELRCGPKKWRVDALQALHTAAEFHMVSTLSKANLAAVHAKRATIKKEDLALVQKIMED